MRRIKTHEDGCGLTELCEVYTLDKPHPVNGAYHDYAIVRVRGKDEATNPAYHVGSDERFTAASLFFQKGPRLAPDSDPGVSDSAVLAVLIDRFEGLQTGVFACAENEEVLKHLRAAAELLKARARERAARGVLGRNEK